MTIHLPLEIYTQIFNVLLDDLYDPERPQEAFKLRFISRSIQGIVDQVLYRKIKSPSYTGVNILCRTIIPRPRLAARVEEIHLEEDEEAESDEEDEGNTDPDSDSGSDSSEYSDSKVQRARRIEESKLLAGAADHLKNKFTSDPSHSLALEKNDLSWLARSTRKTRKWLLLFQLSNLKSLTLETHTDTFTNTALFLRLPRLEKLDFAVLAPGPDGPSCHNYAPPEEILESIIRHTDQLKSLRFEDMSGTVFFPVQHDAPKLKRILEQHAADTLTYLSICLCNNDDKDWRQEQEFSYIRGLFGSMKKFTKLKGLVMQLEVLLGKPSENDGLSLKNVLPSQLEYFTGLNLPDYHGAEDSDRIWDEGQYIPQFEDLAEAAMRDDRAFPSLKSVKMHLHRKDYFSSYGECLMKGQYNDGVLGDSQVYFGFVRGPYAYVGPGPD
ncbi:hypothetical protein CNMCM8927_000025 [Aspergillus lentulus]|uniref:Uncharacterized protein n=1 Tax=Aspergillus lentulus TaxID=293939 RepID=A0AAN5YJQ6_ASPLE|nr:hypothetical protein CNMCM8060_008496 [Aspergillus lentulus]KAF4182376.1 hypothetical protein CNMCM7927_000062 [Aspergillus lentulus]KAF4193033.1 hypothetical protein CNMCM8694_009401 [Aspergillus lentulus]KAF4202630.1 hypothetical protein CNMCM8927_000025 [Aspergillus lentulus]